ncbi:uncharacterized protein JCM15063_001963 [Sporobolomyces koalae]|uniref:uncharacterized protein n=1 Tax=Sporobolomyces koalae TaxID=500713 RepID=UPI003170D3B2
MALPKRPLPSTQSSSQSSSSQVARSRPQKRVRRESPNLDQQPTTALAASAAQSKSSDPATLDTSNITKSLPLPEPKKRVIQKGSLRRLTSGHPAASRYSTRSAVATATEPSTVTLKPTREKQTLNGNRIGGKSKDLKDRVETEDLWVASLNKKTRGLGFSGWLKRGVGAFVERGCTCLRIHAMGAMIPTALSLALAIRDAVPGGSAIVSDEDEREEDIESEDGEYRPQDVDRETRRGKDSTSGVFEMQVRTGTAVVGDEITPEDDDEDMIYQTRTKSTVEIVLSIQEDLAKLVGVGRQFKRGNTSARGGKRRGGMKGRGGGAGRGTNGRGRGK